jgi:hypothetical protein
VRTLEWREDLKGASLAFTRLEKPARNKHSSLFGPFVGYKKIKFSEYGTCVIKLFKVVSDTLVY